MFTEDEAEAIAVGVRMLARTGDPGLQKAAESVLSKVAQVIPDPLRGQIVAVNPGHAGKPHAEGAEFGNIIIANFRRFVAQRDIRLASHKVRPLRSSSSWWRPSAPTLLTVASSPPALASGCALFGLGRGNLVSLPPLIMKKKFGGGDVGKTWR